MYNKKEVIRIVSDLIRIRSTKENEAERIRAIAYVERFFAGEKVYIRKIRRKGVDSLIITIKKEKNPFLLLNGHVDVVPAKDSDFIPKIKGDRLYGRGSGDMKAGIAVMMLIMRDLSRRKEKMSVGLMITTDEEIGGENGVGYLVGKRGYRSKFAIVLDGGRDLNEIVINEKGLVHLKVFACGKGAHGSRPFLGENAIEKLIHRYQKMEKIIPRLQQGQWGTSMSLGKMEGGKSVNAVPDYALMCLDIRFADKKDRTQLLPKLAKAAEGDVEIIAEGDPFVQSPSDPFVRDYLAAAEEVTGQRVDFGKGEGASDARYFCKEGISTVVTRMYCENIHGDNEWVSIAQIEVFYSICMRLLERLKTGK